jgi:ketosteroid isomerase-like protein
MSAENVQLVLSLYEAWNRNDQEAVPDALSPDFEFTIAGIFPGFDPVYRGQEGFAKFERTLREAWQRETFEIDVGRVEDLDDRVLAFIEFTGRGRKSGAEVTMRYGHLFTIENRKIAKLEGFATWEDALAAAGLAE